MVTVGCRAAGIAIGLATETEADGPGVDPQDQPDVTLRSPVDFLHHDDRALRHGQAGVGTRIGSRHTFQCCIELLDPLRGQEPGHVTTPCGAGPVDDSGVARLSPPGSARGTPCTGTAGCTAAGPYGRGRRRWPRPASACSD